MTVRRIVLWVVLAVILIPALTVLALWFYYRPTVEYIRFGQ